MALLFGKLNHQNDKWPPQHPHFTPVKIKVYVYWAVELGHGPCGLSESREQPLPTALHLQLVCSVMDSLFENFDLHILVNSKKTSKICKYNQGSLPLNKEFSLSAEIHLYTITWCPASQDLLIRCEQWSCDKNNVTAKISLRDSPRSALPLLFTANFL